MPLGLQLPFQVEAREAVTAAGLEAWPWIRGGGIENRGDDPIRESNVGNRDRVPGSSPLGRHMTTASVGGVDGQAAQDGATGYEPAERPETTDVAGFDGMTLSPLARAAPVAGPLSETLPAVDVTLVQCVGR